jgi:hypothetical protein
VLVEFWQLAAASACVLRKAFVFSSCAALTLHQQCFWPIEQKQLQLLQMFQRQGVNFFQHCIVTALAIIPALHNSMKLCHLWRIAVSCMLQQFARDAFAVVTPPPPQSSEISRPLLSCVHVTLTFAILLLLLLPGGLLKKLVEAIKDLVTDGNFEATETGISLQAMDTSHVSTTTAADASFLTPLLSCVSRHAAEAACADASGDLPLYG